MTCVANLTSDFENGREGEQALETDPMYDYVFEIENLGRNGTWVYKTPQRQNTNGSDNQNLRKSVNEMRASQGGNWQNLAYNCPNSKIVLDNGDVIGLIRKRSDEKFNLFI